MKKVVGISLVAALLFLGCEDSKTTHHTTTTTKAETTTSTTPSVTYESASSVVSSVVSSASSTATKVIKEALPGTPPVEVTVEEKQKPILPVPTQENANIVDKVTKTALEAVEKAKEVTTQALEKAKEVSAEALEKTSELTQKAKEITTPAIEKAKEITTPAIEKVKEVTTQVVEKTKEVTHEVTEKVAKNSIPLLPGAAPVVASGGDVEKGKTLFTKCASCHGPKGERQALGKSAVIAGMPEEEVIKILKEYKEGKLNKYGMGPLMKGQVANLSDQDIQDLAAYIASLK